MYLKKLASLPRFAAIAALAIAGCRSTPPPDDNSINAALLAKLASDTAISAEPIQTFVQGGVATLQGTVSSPAARALAANDAAQTPGVKSVVNQLTVQTSQPPQQAQQYPQAPPPSVAVNPPTPLALRNPRPSAVPRRPSERPAPEPSAGQQAANQPAPIERRPLRSAQQDQQQQPLPPLEQHQAAPPPPAFRNVTVPSGTTLPVRITQTLDSATTQPGDSFSGTLASDVVIDGLVALPAGTAVNGRVDEVHEAAHFKGSALLTISLNSISRRGDRSTITTEPYTQEGKGRGTNTAEKVGGGAAVGAILGGIFGGGKGAAIGAAAGGGLGAGAQGVTRGQQVQIPSETLIRFRLTNPVDVRTSTTGAADGDANLQRHPSN